MSLRSLRHSVGGGVCALTLCFRAKSSRFSGLPVENRNFCQQFVDGTSHKASKGSFAPSSRSFRHLPPMDESCHSFDATGDWNTRYALNEWFRDLSNGPGAILCCWVSGNGAAVQSFLNLREDDCCLRCLHPKMSEPPRFRPLKPGVEVNQAPATCGDGAYIPYSVAAPATAAGLACDMAIDWANDRPGPRFRTILLDPERGIRREPTSPTRHKDCPSCNRRQLS